MGHGYITAKSARTKQAIYGHSCQGVRSRCEGKAQKEGKRNRAMQVARFRHDLELRQALRIAGRRQFVDSPVVVAHQIHRASGILAERADL